uniref:Cell division protein DedD (Protein involved in septation) n=1 Tax=Candidatus Kentrum sp. TUN TaxID=2126343 RepID=A0A450ZYP9_9GAMM|nr:MAG: Cell division protein DedD (protein involved in septation) [Candidatus Kentron sp. TUN]VFK58934.1 MAG: Cell division protein DedD (protein involved in septation) [Candidatus Kentron sp. TUN]VFK59431.1 MAG: Cell division protein DedD (protein involved in septation) [Candidatus Kentron sp. TUN]
MEEELKYRMVGASVLVLLGVIFIPMILSPSDEVDEALSEATRLESGGVFRSRITPMNEPVVETGLREVFDRTTIRYEAPRIQYEVQPIPPVRIAPPTPRPGRIALEDEANDRTEFTGTTIGGNDNHLASRNRDKSGENQRIVASPRPNVSGKQEPVAWAVQVGSFSKRKNALGLRDLLRTKGYRAFVEFVRVGNVGSIRTRVFVGPVLVRGNALQSAEKLHSDLNIDGIVVRYSGGG